MGNDIGSAAFVLIFALVQLCTAEYVVYGWKMTLDNNMSLNPNRCHHPLNTKLSTHRIKDLNVQHHFGVWHHQFKIPNADIFVLTASHCSVLPRNELLCQLFGGLRYQWISYKMKVWHPTLGGIASICFIFHFQQTLRSQGCQKIRKIVRNTKLPIARSTIHPSLN